MEAKQVVEPGHLDAGPEVDGSDADDRLGDHAGVGLDGRLAVEVDGHVDHAAAELQGGRRGIGPAAAGVEASGCSAPDDLVAAQGTSRSLPAVGLGAKHGSAE